VGTDNDKQCRDIRHNDGGTGETGHTVADNANGRADDDDAQRQQVCAAEQRDFERRDGNAQRQYLCACAAEPIGLGSGASNADRVPDRCRHERLHDPHNTGLTDEHDGIAHVANQHDADGVSERADAACGIDGLSLICGQRRNGSGAAVFLRHATRVSLLSLAEPKGADHETQEHRALQRRLFGDHHRRRRSRPGDR
jgi:hypothetical protein